MASVFWDRKGILLIDLMPPDATINAASYCDSLTRIRRAVQNKKREMLSRGVCLLHENSRPHSAHVTTALLEKLKWDIIGFGGLGVACWPLVPKFTGSNPAEAVRFLGRKNLP